VENKQFFWQDSQTVKFLADIIRENGIIASTTDTVCGLLANISRESFNILHDIKGERGDKPYLVLVSSMEKLQNFVLVDDLNPGILNVMNQFWPGPLTIILRAKTDLPLHLVSKEQTIAVRVPKHDGLLRLLREFDGLFSTSANISGQPVPQTIDALCSEIIESVSCIIRDEKEEKKLPSTLVDFSQENKWVVVREGSITKSEIERYYE
jgi:L-threonylcarbamoyladenylate synthase